MYPVKQSTALAITFFAHDAAGDPVTGLLDAGFTKRISKGAGSFAAMTVTITEMEGGWYGMTLSTDHTNTLGVLTIYLTHSSCEQVNLQYRVTARIHDDFAFPTTSGRSIDVTASGEVALDFDNTSGTLAKTTDLTGFNDLSAADVAAAVWNALRASYVVSGSFGQGAASVQGNVTGSVASVTGAVGSVTGAVGSVTGNVGGNVGGNVTGSVGSLGATAQTNVASAVWGAATSGYNAAGTFGEDNQAHALSTEIAALNDLSAEEVGDATADEVYEGASTTLRHIARICLAVLAGKSGGGGTTESTFRDLADSKNRVVATTDANGNRTAISLTAT